MRKHAKVRIMAILLDSVRISQVPMAESWCHGPGPIPAERAESEESPFSHFPAKEQKVKNRSFRTFSPESPRLAVGSVMEFLVARRRVTDRGVVAR